MRERLSRLFCAVFCLSAVSWGGLALMAQLERRYVQQKRLLTQEAFADLMAIAWTVPGPVAGNVAVLLGYVLRGAPGAWVAGLAATLPFFLVMAVCAALYHAAGLSALSATALTSRFSLILACLIGVTYARQAPTLLHSTRKRWLSLAATAVLWCFHLPIVFFGILAGSFAYGWFSCEQTEHAPISARLSRFEKLALPAMALLLACFVVLPVGQLPVVEHLRQAGAALTLFGGGFSAIPILKGLFFEGPNALSPSVLTLALALTSLCPGPLLNIVPFLGYLQHGLPGALGATAAIFVPTAMLALIVQRWRDRLRQIPRFENAIGYLRAATTAFLAETVLRLASHLPLTASNLLLAALAVLALWRFKVPVYWLYLATGALSLCFS